MTEVGGESRDRSGRQSDRGQVHTHELFLRSETHLQLGHRYDHTLLASVYLIRHDDERVLHIHGDLYSVRIGLSSADCMAQ